MIISRKKKSSSLLLLIMGSVLIPIGALSIKGSNFHFQINQMLKEYSFQKPSELYDVVEKPYHDLINPKIQSSTAKQNSSQTKDIKEVGYQRTFWEPDFTVSTYSKINATLLAIGEHSYIFMEDNCIEELGGTVATKRSETIRDEFDSIIYPRVTDLSGHPDGTLGDIDGDPRIVILFIRNPKYFYSPVNEILMNNSNLCEMIYLGYRASQGNWRSYSLLAHEFQHLIWFNNEMDEPHFTLEALAQYAMYYSGYLAVNGNLARQVVSYLPHPEESLLHWNLGSVDSPIDYGSAYLFAFYIVEHYGIEILRNLIMEASDGAQGIEAVLQAAGYDITFNELYLDWITALTIDELGFDNNLYGFEEINAKITRYDSIDTFPLLDESISLRYYGFNIQKLLAPPDNFTVQIMKSSDHAIGVSVVLHDSSGWHVCQKIHNETDTIVSDSFKGNSIDVAYLITSYILDETPSTPFEDGLGPSTDIEISIIQSPTTTPTSTSTPTTTPTNTSTPVLTPVSIIGMIAGFMVIAVFKKKKTH